MAANQQGRKSGAASAKKNITGKTSAGRKTASSNKGKSGSRQQTAARRNTSSTRKNSKVSRMQVQEYNEPIGDEIKLIIILAVSILILLSVFGLGGRVGDRAAYIFFGLFGVVAYALPFLLFIGSAFHISNRGSRLARIKLCSAAVFLIMIMALVALSDPSFDGNMSVIDGYVDSAASRSGGGIVGCSLTWLLFTAFGRAGTTVIFVCIMLISGVLLTGKRLFVRISHLILTAVSSLSAGFSSWREKRAEERLLRAERAEYESDSDDDSILEDDEDFEDVRTQPVKKSVPNIIIGKAKKASKTEEPAKTETETPVAADVSEVSSLSESAPEATSDLQTAVLSKEPDSSAPDIKPFTKEQLDSYDHGKAVQPLHIQIPEFMKPTVLSPG